MEHVAYAAARASAAAIHARLAEHRRQAELDGESHLGWLPDPGSLARVIDAAFWASLRREEGVAPKISLAFLTPSETADPLVLDRPLPLDPATLTRVAPAVERPGIHLGVADTGAGLLVWGVARAVPRCCAVVEVAEPGLLVIKQRRGEGLAKFANVAVLQGDRVTLVDERASRLPDCPALLTSLLGFDDPASWTGTTSVLVQLALSMRAHGRGGLIVVVPAATAAWHESLVHPLLYAVAPPFSELARLAQQAEALRPGSWHEELARAIDAVAGLTAVDGATVLTSRYELLAFGGKIVRRRGSAQVDQVMVTEPVEGGTADVMPATQIGGTRHLAAAQFVHDQRDALALVASQDGRFTIFVWSPSETLVHAHRVEALLL
jgi:hypothetical protein